MTTQYAGYEAAPEEITPAQEPESPQPPARQCTRCGGVGTHYLTCSRLQLPSGYRFIDDDQRPAAPRRPSGGPGHPDWPRPPQR